MSDVREFLQARVEEDLNFCHHAVYDAEYDKHFSPEWINREGDDPARIVDVDNNDISYDEGRPTLGQARYITRFDPQRISFEISAKLNILAMSDIPERVLMTMACVYRNHDDFQQEWMYA